MLNAIWLRHGQDESHNPLGRVLRLVVEQWGAANPTKSSWRDDTAKMEEEKHQICNVCSWDKEGGEGPMASRGI